MDQDRRKDARVRVLRRGRIVFRKGHSAIDCVLLDMSVGGARLRTPAALTLPDRFELRIDDGAIRDVAICHRGADIAGVRFLGAA